MKAWLDEGYAEPKKPISPEVQKMNLLNEETDSESEQSYTCEVCGLDEDEMSDEEELRNGVDADRLRVQEETGGVMKRLLDPRLPSKEEVKEHELSGHLPYRNWCPCCVKAKGKELDHRKDAGAERGLSEYAFDYCFPGGEFGSS